MVEKAAANATNTDAKTKKAKRLFFVGLMDLSWRLAAALVLSIIIGAYLDKTFDKNPIFTIIGLIIGFLLSAWIIRKIVLRLQKETS